MAEMSRLAVPVLVSVTVVTGLVVLMVRVPKLTLDAFKVIAGEDAAVTVNAALLVLALDPAAVVNAPAGMVTVYVAGAAEVTGMAIVHEPIAGMLPMPKL